MLADTLSAIIVVNDLRARRPCTAGTSARWRPMRGRYDRKGDSFWNSHQREKRPLLQRVHFRGVFSSPAPPSRKKVVIESHSPSPGGAPPSHRSHVLSPRLVAAGQAFPALISRLVTPPPFTATIGSGRSRC